MSGSVLGFHRYSLISFTHLTRLGAAKKQKKKDTGLSPYLFILGDILGLRVTSAWDFRILIERIPASSVPCLLKAVC